MVAPAMRTNGLTICIWLVTSVVVAHADHPMVAFDFGRTAECRDVTSEIDGDVYPDEKTVEVRLRVSVHLLAGDIRDVEEVRIEAGDCDSRLRVHSFAPATRLESHLSEDIRWTKTTESAKSLGASLGGEAPVPVGDMVAHVMPSLSAGVSGREVITETQKRVAPQQAVVASGTIGQEHGVFFKLRSSPQSSLEGVHELTLRFIVPKRWRGDSLRVCCTATGQEKFLWIRQQATWARTCAPVAIFLAGDLEARQAAERHVAAKVAP